MWSDLLLGLAWLVMVLLPAVVGYRLLGVSNSGYLEDDKNAPASKEPAPEPATDSAADLGTSSMEPAPALTPES